MDRSAIEERNSLLQIIESPHAMTPETAEACRKIIGGESDPFAASWRDMPRAERAFRLQAARLSPSLADKKSWGEVPGDARAKLKSSLYRAAKRAGELLCVAS